MRLIRDDQFMPVTVMPAALADRLRETGLTYGEAGATGGALPPGYHHLHRRAVIGSGPQVFTAAANALASWQVHARAGLVECIVVLERASAPCPHLPLRSSDTRQAGACHATAAV
jgi:hypothetical protein